MRGEWTRRAVLGVAAAGVSGVWPALPGEAVADDGLVWFDASRWRTVGQGWPGSEGRYGRLPLRLKSVVRDAVWRLGENSAGLEVWFETNAPQIHVRYELAGALAMPHMPATGVSGVDLYRADAGAWRWVGVAKPSAARVQATLGSGLPSGKALYRLYLPLYNSVRRVEIGTPRGSVLWPHKGPATDPIIVYGTSIAQGACASRPGMAWPAVLGRMLDREVVNLGFSGNGWMEEPLAKLMGERDAAAYVVDCLPNMTAELVARNAAPFVRTLRAVRPTTPIVMVEDRTFAHAWAAPAVREQHAARRDALRLAVADLKADRVPGLYLVPGEFLLGDDSEGTTDGSHPNDLGMVRMAEALAPALRPLLPGV